MKKSIWIFLLAVLLPSAVLGWLALRSAEEQQIVLERRTAELYQKETAAVAEAARALIESERRAFTETVRQLLARQEAGALARDFAPQLAANWPRRAIGFALNREGSLASPSAQGARSNADWQKFLLNNSGFLSSTMPAQVYWVANNDLSQPEVLRSKSKLSADNGYLSQTQAPADAVKAMPQRRATIGGAAPAGEIPKAEQSKDKALTNAPAAGVAPAEAQTLLKMSEKEPAQMLKSNMEVGTNATQTQEAKPTAAQADARDRQDLVLRNVLPQRVLDEKAPSVSQLNTTTAEFKVLTADATEGVVTRFTQDRLDIIFWLRPATAPEMIFGCLVEAESLREVWAQALPAAAASERSRGGKPEFVLALLDDKARPVATQPLGETGRDWKRPFVASEIGEALPHWEAALYLMRPQQLEESAHALRRSLIFLITAALGAIACGGWLVVADARRQLALAQKKADFVSNVSHELKTPLTSIRMFAELMHSGRAGSTEKHPQYLRIIMVEAERLTRLINNVLDFARLERRQKRYDKRAIDLHDIIARTWESHELHLRESGFTTRWQAAPPPYPVLGDDDALAQVLVNLFSNAEKYAGERKEVELHSYLDGQHVCVSVLDRGPGVPAGEERKIFEAFYRAHDSLSSGIQGSGLGLTLAQRIAEDHGGEIVCQAREGGGSRFTLRLPLAEENRSPTLPDSAL